VRLVDTHAHLFWEDFEPDLEEVISRARNTGLEAILNLGTDVDTSRACVALADRYPVCRAAVGIHPNDASLHESDIGGVMDRIAELLEHPHVVAVGETGIDLYRDQVPLETQLRFLEIHFELARAHDLPIVLHNRQADREIREALLKWDEGVTAILHCFLGDVAFGRWAIERGHYLGLGGVFTFPSSSLREMVGEWDRDHLLLETDSPFLSPVPFRGRRNEPARVADVATAVAEALGIPPGTLARQTTANAARVFSLTDLGGPADLSDSGT